MKDLFFCPDLWRFDAEVESNVGSLKTVRSFDGKEILAWQLADWNYNWTTLRTELELEPGEEYRFCFWLNGGENDRYDEVCTLEIYGDKWEERESFRLNRGLTKPELIKNGWYLFAIPFTAPVGEKTTFRINAMGAIATFAGTDAMETYAGLVSDAEDEEKPQRPNLVFPGGWPVEAGQEPAFRFENSPTKQQVKTVAKIAGGVLVAALLIRHFTKKKK